MLWIAASHVQPAWAHAPRLVIRAPEKRCGKSRLLDVIEATCHEPLITVNASSAAVYRAIGTDDPPTLLVDEADTIFGSRKAAEANEDLRGLLNAGHQRGMPGLEMTWPWTASNTPWPASASTTSHSEPRNPAAAAATKTMPTIASTTSTPVDAPIAANNA